MPISPTDPVGPAESLPAALGAFRRRIHHFHGVQRALGNVDDDALQAFVDEVEAFLDAADDAVGDTPFPLFSVADVEDADPYGNVADDDGPMATVARRLGLTLARFWNELPTSTQEEGPDFGTDWDLLVIVARVLDFESTAVEDDDLERVTELLVNTLDQG